MTKQNNFPKISIVTPSFNQAEYLEETIKSVLSQNYPNLEYIIIDGGSTDGSVEIIRRYSDRISYWVSEPDKGRGEAINKGFQHATGEIMGWLGCGDKYFPWTFEVVSQIFSALPEVKWLTSDIKMMLNKEGSPCFLDESLDLYRINLEHISRESTFWRMSLYNHITMHKNKSLPNGETAEFWLELLKLARLNNVSTPLGGSRPALARHKESSGPVTLQRRMVRCNVVIFDWWEEYKWKLTTFESRTLKSRLYRASLKIISFLLKCVKKFSPRSQS
ncbi:MAG: glycosyltransferase family 2 protein [Candidatus Omnitrophica bacterium]|nr:glycosyltransferase family 2 protein [Candidatus Omnitrophota bacterium]MDD5652847.1 glycosyltransferase family 2 protein [Candidatus Omnitrophota bacterium]